MSASTEKASRKELRRAIGMEALDMLHTFDARLVVANSLMSAHTTRLGEHDAALDHHAAQLRVLTEQVHVLTEIVRANERWWCHQ